MVFSSLTFIYLFLPCVLLVYFASPKRLRNLVLVAGSLVFYAWGEPSYLLLMLFSTVFDYGNGIWIEKHHTKNNVRGARAVLLFSVLGNLGILCFFKYSDFLIHTVNTVLGSKITPPGLPLPIGISFYTFQTMSYSIDVYRKEICAQRNLIDFAAYVTCFPQLVAGPIVRYRDIAKDLKNRSTSLDDFAEGIRRLVTGLAKKVLLANQLGEIWERLSHVTEGELSVAAAWLGAAAFTLQIYFDFSGYSDMAIGLGRMFGFRYPENFDYPYRSQSITEFWRRWHISLGTWFREYVYIPLGGGRKGRRKQLRNLLVVWCLTGLWHGAGWNFLIWGLYFGILLIIEKFILKPHLVRAPVWVQHLYTMALVTVSWVLFAFEDIQRGIRYIGVMFGMNAGAFCDGQAWYYLRTNFILFLVCILASTGCITNIAKRISAKDGFRGMPVLRIAVLVLMFVCSISFLVGSSYNPFLYFRF